MFSGQGTLQMACSSASDTLSPQMSRIVQSSFVSYIIIAKLHIIDSLYTFRDNATTDNLVNQSRGSGRLVLPVRRQHGDGSVVSSQSVDSGLDQNQSELGVLVLSVSLQVLSDRDSLLDQEVQVLRKVRSQTVRLQDSQDLVTGDNLGLGDTVSVSQHNTNLRRSQTLSGVLDDLLDNLVSGQLEPSWRVSGVGSSRRRNTFTLLC